MSLHTGYLTDGHGIKIHSTVYVDKTQLVFFFFLFLPYKSFPVFIIKRFSIQQNYSEYEVIAWEKVKDDESGQNEADEWKNGYIFVLLWKISTNWLPLDLYDTINKYTSNKFAAVPFHWVQVFSHWNGDERRDENG